MPIHTQQGGAAQQAKRLKPRMADSPLRQAAAADLVVHLAACRSGAACNLCCQYKLYEPGMPELRLICRRNTAQHACASCDTLQQALIESHSGLFCLSTELMRAPHALHSFVMPFCACNSTRRLGLHKPEGRLRTVSAPSSPAMPAGARLSQRSPNTWPAQRPKHPVPR